MLDGSDISERILSYVLRGLIFEEENQIFKGLTPLTNDFFVVVVCYT